MWLLGTQDVGWTTWVCILALPLDNRIILGKLLCAVPQFPDL